MRLFQYVAVAILAAALVFDMTRAARRRRLGAMLLARGLTWVAAAVAILFPELVQEAAVRLGIRRGADLVLYIFILLSLFSSFYFYARYKGLQRQVTELIRRHAIEHARRGGRTPPSGNASY
jgi:small membrane protein